MTLGRVDSQNNSSMESSVQPHGQKSTDISLVDTAWGILGGQEVVSLGPASH